jgi:gamma-glutamylputrescine oxidase
MTGPATTDASTYYRASAGERQPAPRLRGPIDAQVCVVGGGFAGLNTALGLAERGQPGVALLEAESAGFGASGRNGGFVFAGFSRGEQALLDDLGPQRAARLYRGTVDAVELIRSRVDRYRIDCERVDAGVIWANWFRDPERLRRRQRLLELHFGSRWEWLERDRLRELVRSERYHDGLFEPGAFHFHPLKYARGLADRLHGMGVAVHENSPVRRLLRDGAGWRVETPEGSVRAAQVVLACGGYLAGLRRKVDAAVLPIATYVMVTEPLGERMQDILRTRAAIYDTRFAFDYYRPLPDTRLLWGGRISIRDRSPAQVQRLLLRDLRRVFPQLGDVRVEQAWSGLMSYARHEMPQLARLEPGLWLAQAFGGHGVAPTTLAGEALAEAILGDDARLREFSPYGMVGAFKPAGFLAAQANYWWLQARDAWDDRRGR